ncbi:SHOCT domain-containing protein [soil metagenome]
MWDSFWDFFWSLIVVFAFIAYLMILFNILTDLFWRDHKTSGWLKAIWVFFLVVFPYVTALVYLIARGQGMTERAKEAAANARQHTQDYIKQAAGRSPAQEIADAKALLEAGTISASEFESLKAKALT